MSRRDVVDEGGTDVYHWAPFPLGSMASELLRKECVKICESECIMCL